MSCPALCGERAVLAVPGEAAVDETRVARARNVGSDPEPLDHAGAEHLERGVGAAR